MSKFLFRAVAVLFAYALFFPTLAAAQTTIGVCKTSYSQNTAGTCRTQYYSCKDNGRADNNFICDKASGVTDRQKCREQAAAANLNTWSNYDVKETVSIVWDDLYGGNRGKATYSYNLIRSYSIADKLCSSSVNSCPQPQEPYLWSSSCEGTAISKYKTCCLITNSSNPEYSPRELYPARQDLNNDDGVAPPEGLCSGSGVETVKGVGCPQPPTIVLTANDSVGTLNPDGSRTVKVKNGVDVTLRWTISGFDRLRYSNITGVAESPASGFHVLPPFKAGTPIGTKYPDGGTLRISADDNYLIPCVENDAGCPRVVIKVVDLILESAGDDISDVPDCPIQLPKSADKTTCSQFNSYPKRTDGKLSPDGTNNDYTKDKIEFVSPPLLPDGRPSCKARDDQSVGCYLANCSRCSNTSPNIGKFATWSSDSVEYTNANKACLTFPNVQYTPVSGFDNRCVEPLGCVIDIWEVDPKTVTKGNNTNITWRAKSLTPSDAFGPNACKMRQESSKPSTEKTVAPEKTESFGPITEDTTFTLNCVTDSGKTCSAGGGTSGLVRVGCEITEFVSRTGTEIRPNYYETESATASLSWEVANAESCLINGAPASDRPYDLQAGENKFDLGCRTRSSPGTMCEKSITVKRLVPTPTCTISSFTASPSVTARPGDSSNLSWTTNAGNCSLSGGGISATGNPRTSPYPFTVNPIETTTYTLSCDNGGCSRQTTVTVTPAPAGSQIRVDPGLSIDRISSSPQCLPENGTGTRYTVSYNASTINPCVGLIGGGSDSPRSINCQVTTGNWSPSLQGSGSQTFSTISQTTTYGISCQRSTYSCSRSDQEWKSGTRTQNLANCQAARTAALNDPDVKSATCVNTGCFDYYTSANCPYENRSSCCNSWSQCSDTYGPCVDKKPKGYCSGSFASCSSNSDCDIAGTCGEDKKCSGSNRACTSNSDCTTAGTCTNIVNVGVCQSNKSWSCQSDSSCRYSYDCKSNYSCNSFKCKLGSDGQPYEGYRLDVVSKDIVSPPVSGQTVVRYVQKPYSPNLVARQDTRTITQILLNQLFDLSWSVSAPNSFVPTFMNCTASGSGDPEVWNTQTNRLPSSGTVKDFFGRFLSPSQSTRYYLWCRNQDQVSPSSCYNDGPTNSIEVKVFTPDLQEKGPNSFNFMEKFKGMIAGAVR